MTCPQDHNDNQAQTCTSRWRSLQAKLARPSLRLTTPLSGEPIVLYAPSPQTLYKGSQDTHLDRFTSSTISLILHHSRAPRASLQAVHLLALALLPLPSFSHPHCKNFRAFKRGTHTRSSLRLDIGLQPKPV